MMREFWCETEGACERRRERLRQTVGDRCPVLRSGTGCCKI